MNIGFNLKSPAALSTNKRSSLSFQVLKSGIKFSSLAMNILDSIFFQYNFIYIENLMFSVAIFINYLV